MIDGSRPRAAPVLVTGPADKQLRRRAAGELGRFLDDDMDMVKSRLETTRRNGKMSAAQLQADKIAMARRKLEVLKRFVETVRATGDARRAAALAKEIARLVGEINSAVRALAAMGGGAGVASAPATWVAAPAAPPAAKPEADAEAKPEAQAETEAEPESESEADAKQATPDGSKPGDPERQSDQDRLGGIRRSAIEDARKALRLAQKLLEMLSQVRPDDADDAKDLRRAVGDGLEAVLHTELDILAVPSDSIGHVDLSV